LATTRFETPPGRTPANRLGERLVEIGAAKIKAFVFVATLAHRENLSQVVDENFAGQEAMRLNRIMSFFRLVFADSEPLRGPLKWGSLSSSLYHRAVPSIQIAKEKYL
jgi:hypothetical protein